MIAFAWKMLAWFGMGVVIALSVLIVPLHVAAERKRLDSTTREIVAAQRDIRALETEFETRANIAQLERWNGDTLRLASPVAGQFVRDEAALASLDFNAPLGNGGSDVRVAAAIVPAQLNAPTAVAAAVVPSAAPSAVTPNAAPNTAAPARMAAAAPQRAAKIGGQAVAMLDRKLLSDSMLGDLVSGASAEKGRSR